MVELLVSERPVRCSGMMVVCFVLVVALLNSTSAQEGGESCQTLTEQVKVGDLYKLAAKLDGDIGIRVGATEQDHAISEALDQVVKMEFPGNPLRDVLDFLSQLHDIPIVVDRIALDALKIEPEVDEVEMIIDGVTLRNAMRLLLHEYRLDFIVRDEVLFITAKEIAAQHYETRVYDLRLIDADRDWNELGKGLLEVVMLTAGDSAWGADSGGAAYIDSQIVVRQTQVVHEQIEELLKLIAARPE